jgi:hypothetical protein
MVKGQKRHHQTGNRESPKHHLAMKKDKESLKIFMNVMNLV